MQIQQLLTDAAIPREAAHLKPTALTAKTEHITKGTLFFLTEGVSYDTSRLLPYILAKKPLAIVINNNDIINKPFPPNAKLSRPIDINVAPNVIQRR